MDPLETALPPRTMWTPGSPILDEPVTVFFWEFRDFQIMVGIPIFGSLPLGPVVALACGVAFGVATWFFKRGQPAGALPHLLHAWECWLYPGGLLPGLLSLYPQRYSPWPVGEWT